MGLFDWFFKDVEKYVENTRQENLANEILNRGVADLEALNKNKHKLSVNSNLVQSPTGFRPITFDQYIGQTKAKSILKAYIEGTRSRNKIFPHLLIHGNAGCGKTSLAKLLAKELGVKFQEIVSTSVESIQEIIDVIRNAEGGIVFLDEIHGLSREMVEPLYPIMEDFRNGEEVFQPFTLIGATTEIGEIIKSRRPFYDRFKIKQELEDYTATEIESIIRQYKEKLFTSEILDNHVYQMISFNSRFTPRIAINLLEATIYLGGDIRIALQNFSIISDGYTTKDLMVLENLNASISGLGLQAIASQLGTSKQNYEYDIEPYLLKNGLVMRTPRGRKITEKGKEMIVKLKSSSN